MMTHLLVSAFGSNKEVVITFANTGQEHEKTLEFVQRCADHFGWNVVWVEAVVREGHGNGTIHRLVDFNTASRDGKPFEDVIQKFGIPNQKFLHCTRELKDRPITSYLRSIGWKAGSYSTAVGIRDDELDRISPTMKARGFVYPCADWGITEEDVARFWDRQPFTLEIPEHWGNCVWCWKKSPRKLMTLAKAAPEIFEFPARMERLYPNAGAGDGNRRFFRGRKLTGDILKDAQTLKFEPFVDGRFIDFDEDLDVGGSCGDSCEIGADAYAEEDDFDYPPGM